MLHDAQVDPQKVGRGVHESVTKGVPRASWSLTLKIYAQKMILQFQACGDAPPAP
jgi:hypothetical protein